MIKLQWVDESTSTTQLGLLRVLVEWEGGLHPKGSNLPTGYRVTVYGKEKRQLSKLFTSRNNAKIAAERLLWKIVNEMHQELSQYSWDTYNKEEVKWVVR